MADEVTNVRAPVRELGYQNDPALSSWGALQSDNDEDNPDLRWPHSVKIYDRMRSEDSQVESVLRAVTLPIIAGTWVLDPNGAPEHVVAHVAEDLGVPVRGRDAAPQLRTRDRFSWEEHLRLALLELPFGHSVFEQVYRIEGDLARLRKLAWRPPRTISAFNTARDGGLVSVEQSGGRAAGGATIPVARLVVYTNQREGAKWYGRSVLRAAYKNWLLKDRGVRAQALTVERNGLGVPVYKGSEPPEGMSVAEQEAWIAAERDAGLALATSVRGGDSAGVSIPYSAEFTMQGVDGRLPDLAAPIRYHDEQIARAVLAHFLNLGTETGSWALGSTFASFFTNSLNAVARQIASVTQQHVIEDLVDVNYGPAVAAPKLVCLPIGSEHPATAEAVKMLIDAGVLTVTPALEAAMRQRYGLPSEEELEGVGGSDA